MNPVFYRLLSLIVCAGFLATAEQSDLSTVQDAISPADHLLADQLTDSISNTEWLGVLAPIAISPFFGITCLAGMSQFGEEWLGMNSFISTNPVLHDPAVFWIFFGLTILTSLPRLTKVSKPLAQAADQVETYSAIIILLIIRFMATTTPGEPEQIVMQMGMFSFTADVLMSLAAVINIVVINTVKFFFEILVWLTPFPFVDALLEVANKTACAGLLAIYAFSPLIATTINLVMFAICLLMFFWIHRRVTFMRIMLFDAVWALFDRRFGVPKTQKLVVFPTTGFRSIPGLAMVHVQRTEHGWNLIPRRWFLKAKVEHISEQNRVEIKSGIMFNSLVIVGPDGGIFYFSRRFTGNLEQLAALMDFEVDRDVDPETGLNTA